MKEKVQQSKSRFCVFCIWCNAKIRKDKEEDSYGVCLKCFYRILDDHLRSLQPGKIQFASDR
jgi:hypothetical protein